MLWKVTSNIQGCRLHMSTKSSMLLGVYSIGFDIGNFSLTITAGYDEVKSYEATFFNVLPT